MKQQLSIAEGSGWDVLIAGAGLAASAVAIPLARQGWRVACIESRPQLAWKIGETLPPTAKPLLGELGVLHFLEADGHRPSFGNQSAWGSAELTDTDFLFHPHGCGWQLDRTRFDARLAATAVGASAV